MKPLLPLFLIFFLLPVGCSTTGISSQPKDLPIKIPQSFSNSSGKIVNQTDQWDFFNNPELKSIVETGLQNNFDVQVIRARIDQAKAALEKKNAAFFPDLDYSLGGQKKGTRTKKKHSSPSTYDGSHSWDASATAAWVPDLWGEKRADKSSGELTVSAVQKDLTDAKHDLISQIAQDWIDVIATRRRRITLEKQIQVSVEQFELQKVRYMNGNAEALDVSQQSEALAEIRSQEPLLERSEKQLIHAIGLLLGSSTIDADLIRTLSLPELQTVPSAGLPSHLLANRPDLAAARDRLTSLQYDVKVAQADFLPSLTLSAKALFSSGELDLLFHNWVGTLTAALAGSIFDGGVKEAEVARAKAAVKEQVASYAKLVSQALYEVEDLLVAIRTQDRYISLLEEELTLAKLTEKDARIQYWNGKSSYLNVLTISSRIKQLERQMISERATALKDRIQLYRALGFKELEAVVRKEKAENKKNG